MRLLLRLYNNKFSRITVIFKHTVIINILFIGLAYPLSNTYENNFIVNAEFKYQTKLNLSEDFNGSNWFYSIVNDSVIEKTKSTGGSTIYFYKTDKSYLDDLLEFDECNY